MADEKRQSVKKNKAVKIVGGVLTGIFVAFIAFGCFVLISGKINAKKSNRDGAPTPIGNSYLPIVVITDSMEPKYKVNTAIFVHKEDCAKIKENFDNGYTYDLTFYDGYSKSNESDLTAETINFLKDNHKTFRTGNLNTTMTHKLMYIQENENVEYGNGRYYFFVEGINRSNKSTGAVDQYQVFTENELYGVCKGNSNFLGGLFVFVTSGWGLVILLLIPSSYMIISSLYDLFKKTEDTEEGTSKNDGDPLAGLSKANQKKLKEEMLNDLINNKEEK